MALSTSQMLSQSITVLTQPRIETFEQLQGTGTKQDGLRYVIAAAIVSAVAAIVFGLLFMFFSSRGFLGVIGGGLAAFILPIVGYYVFAFLVYTVGKSQGGADAEDAVFYAIALYTAPLLALNGIVGSIPLLNCLAAPLLLVLGLYQIYLTYLATRASMNLESTPAIITIVVAWVVELIVFAILGGIFAALGLGAAAAGGLLGG